MPTCLDCGIRVPPKSEWKGRRPCACGEPTDIAHAMIAGQRQQQWDSMVQRLLSLGGSGCPLFTLSMIHEVIDRQPDFVSRHTHGAADVARLKAEVAQALAPERPEDLEFCPRERRARAWIGYETHLVQVLADRMGVDEEVVRGMKGRGVPVGMEIIYGHGALSSTRISRAEASYLDASWTRQIA